ncbi:MAG TPA: zinc ABC transporter substrate-binding protein [Atribacteraceae bacterium]|nr:zinc ABC transporter substrate-binding protein [Atribacteraceae bacterium]
MKQAVMLKLGLVLTIIGSLLITGLLNRVSAQTAPTLNVVTTTGMLADAVRNVGQERVTVTALMGPGIDPHLYRASEGDVRRLAQADVIFYNGLLLEARIADVLGRMSDRVTTVAVGEAIDPSLLLTDEVYEEQHDPHIWFDVSLWGHVVDVIGQTLIAKDPDNASFYRSNMEEYLDTLNELHRHVMTQAEKIPPRQRVLITAHDAFGYFGRAYGFSVRGLQGISTEAEAGIRDVQDLATFITEHQIPAIFIESTVPVRNIEAVQAAVLSMGFEVAIGGELYSDAMGSEGTPEGTYVGMVRYNIDTIVTALLRE